MQAVISPAAIDLQEPVSLPVRPRPKAFLDRHWELKLLAWGLAIIGLSYPAAYFIYYYQARTLTY